MKRLRLGIISILLIISSGVYGDVLSKNKLALTDITGKIVTINYSKKGKTFFIDSVDKLTVLNKGEIESVSGSVDLRKGILDSEKAFAINLNKSGSFVIESSLNGNIDVKEGDLSVIASLQKDKQLRKSNIKVIENNHKIEFLLSKTPDKVRLFTLDNPSRVIFDFIGIKGNVTNKKIRSANHPSGYRVVIDKNDVPKEFSIIFQKNSFSLFKSNQNTYASFKEILPKNKNIANVKKHISKAGKKETEKVTKQEITGVAFIGEEPSVLKLSSKGRLALSKAIKGNKIEMFIKDSFISKNREQIIDTSSLNGSVKEIAIYNEKNGVKIIAVMNNEQFNVSELIGKNNIELKFSKKDNVNIEENVAGFNEQVVKLPSEVSISTKDITQYGSGSVRNKRSASEKGYTGKKVSLDFKNADILDVLRLVSEISRLNIVAGDDVKGSVTVRLINVPWDEALDVVLKSKSLGKERLGSIIRVATLRTLQTEKEAELAKIKAEQKLEPLKIRLIAVNYAVAADLLTKVKELLTDRGSVTEDSRTNVLIIKDIKEVLDKAEQLVEYLDTQTPQVMIAAKIIESSISSDFRMGIAWDVAKTYDVGHANPTGLIFPYNLGLTGNVNAPVASNSTGSLGINMGSIGNSANLNLLLQIREESGDLKIISSPKVATMDHTPASIEQGIMIPTITRDKDGGLVSKYVDATLKLDVTPHITSDGSISMSIKINKREPDWSRVNIFGDPAIIKKEATTEVLVESGDTIVIGGVYTNSVNTSHQGIPFLSDIPILGWLFKNKLEIIERSELLIFLTPTIMNKVKSNLNREQSEE